MITGNIQTVRELQDVLNRIPDDHLIAPCLPEGMLYGCDGKTEDVGPKLLVMTLDGCVVACLTMGGE